MPNCSVCGGLVDVDADEGDHWECLGIPTPKCSKHGKNLYSTMEPFCPDCLSEVAA